MTAPTPDEHDDKIAEAIASGLCKSRGTGQCAPLCLSHMSTSTSNGQCPEAKNIWRREVAGVTAQLAARGLCITPIAPTTGAGFADGMRKAAEIAREYEARPKHARREYDVIDAILAAIPSAPSPTPAREREVVAEAIFNSLCPAVRQTAEDELYYGQAADAAIAALDALRSRPALAAECSGATKMHGGFIDAHGQAVQPGDKVLYQFKPGVHTIGEIMPDGDADITYDDGTHDCVKWVRCCKAPIPQPLPRPLASSGTVGKEGPAQTGAGLAEEFDRYCQNGISVEVGVWARRNRPAILAALRPAEAHGEAIEALRPFAAEAQFYDAKIIDATPINDDDTDLKVGHLRRARAALAKLKASP